jgi:hypothetical protein
MIISIGTEKAFDKIQHLLIKALKKLVIEGTYANIIKVIYDKLIVNVILNGEELSLLLLKLNFM